MADGFEIFDCPVRKNDSELDHVCSTLAQRLKSFISYPVAIVWMNPLQHSFEVGEAMPRIETPDSITFFRPVDRPPLAKNNGAGVAQPLCFGQIRFAAPERVFGALAFRDVARQAQKPTSALFSLAYANLDREGGAVLAPMAGLERDRFPGEHALLQALDGRIVETNVEIAFMFTD